MGILLVFPFSRPLKYMYPTRTFRLGQNHPSINTISNGIDPTNNSCVHKFSHFDNPTKYQYLIGITNVTPMALLT